MMVKLAGDLKDEKKIDEMKEELSDLSISPTTRFYDKLILAYAKIGKIDEKLEQLLAEMKDHKIKLEIGTFNSILRSAKYAKHPRRFLFTNFHNISITALGFPTRVGFTFVLFHIQVEDLRFSF